LLTEVYLTGPAISLKGRAAGPAHTDDFRAELIPAGVRHLLATAGCTPGDCRERPPTTASAIRVVAGYNYSFGKKFPKNNRHKFGYF
jgi:hypothetical protein